jgi:hypothetical protein
VFKYIIIISSIYNVTKLIKNTYSIVHVHDYNMATKKLEFSDDITEIKLVTTKTKYATLVIIDST